MHPTQLLVLLATKQLVSMVTPKVQKPFWPSQYEEMQLVQTVADVQVAQGDVHAVQAVPLKKYPVAHTVQVLGAATMVGHGIQEAPLVTTEKPALHVAQTAAAGPSPQ